MQGQRDSRCLRIALTCACMRGWMPTLAFVVASWAAVAAHAQNPGDVVWMTPIRGQGWSCPTVGPDGAIYYVTHIDGGWLYKIDPQTGAILDRAPLRGAAEHSAAMDSAGNLYVALLPASVDPNNPYFGQTRGGVMSFRSADLSLRWYLPFVGPGSDNSPLIGEPQHPQRIYVGRVGDPRLPPDFVCPNRGWDTIDAQSGALVYHMPVEGWQAVPGAVTPDGTIVFANANADEYCDPNGSGIVTGTVHAVAGDDAGTMYWEYNTTDEMGAPVSYHDGIAWTNGRDGYLYGFDVATGAVVFQRYTGTRGWAGVTLGIHPVTGNLLLFTGTGSEDRDPSDPLPANQFYIIEVDGSSDTWGDGRVIASRTVAGGLAFGNPAIDNLGYVYFASTRGNFYCFSWDGVLQWSYELPGAGTIALGGVGGPTITDNGLVVTGSNGGYVVAFRAFGDHLADDVPWPKYKHDLRNTSNVLTPIRDSAIPGDLDGSGCVDLNDLATLLNSFGGPGSASDGDLDGDGDVDLADLAQLLANYGQGC